nr:MauE/DoxX family redox-associated membrane protein [Acidomonas methanolica]
MLVSGLGKAFSQRDLLGTIAAYRILPHNAPYPVFAAAAGLLTACEILLGLGLLSGCFGAGWGSAALFTLFTLAVVTNLLRGRRHIKCGCGLNGAEERLSWAVAARAAMLAVIAALLDLTGWRHPDHAAFVPRLAGAALWLIVLAALRLRTLRPLEDLA